ncbi:MAG: hypothetical protein WCY93_10540 [Anaerolineaceae bacterium]
MKKCIVITVLLFVIGLQGCSSSQPSEETIRTAITETQFAEPTETIKTTTPAPILLKEIDISKRLLSPDDLAFLGIYETKDLHICPTKTLLEGWVDVNQYNFNNEAGIAIKHPGCTSTSNNFSIEQFIFLKNNPREAARVSEGLQYDILFRAEQISGLFGFSYETQLFKHGDSSIWIYRVNQSFESSHLLIVVNEAIISLEIDWHLKLVQDDLIELADVAIQKLLNQDYP